MRFYYIKILPTISADGLCCPKCGSKMVGTKSVRKNKEGKRIEHLYYTCSQFHNKGVTACHSNGVRIDLIDKITLKKITKDLNSESIANEINQYKHGIEELKIENKMKYGEKLNITLIDVKSFLKNISKVFNI